MPTFVALVYETAPRPEPTDPAFLDYIEGYNQFGGIAGAAITGGAALLPPELATTIRVDGGRDGEVLLTDGPFAETKEWLGGFYLLEADDLDGAIAKARHIPAAWRDGGMVEIRPAMDMGM